MEVISRDRASAYSQAATEAAPTAVQVADRFHLLVNLREAVERTLQPRTAAIRALVMKSSASAAPPPPPATGTATPDTAGVSRRQDLFERVRRLHRYGLSLRRIARELNLHDRTLERYARSDTCPDWNAGHARPSGLDRHAEWIRGRLSGGCRSVDA